MGDFVEVVVCFDGDFIDFVVGIVYVLDVEFCYVCEEVVDFGVNVLCGYCLG